MPDILGEIQWEAAVPHVIRVAIFIILAYIFWRIVHKGIPHGIRVLMRRDLKTKDGEEVKQRMDTLHAAADRVVSSLIILAVVFVILAEVGMNIGPFLAGLGVAGIAIGFAAQHLVRDLLNGFIMLIEDWYAKGDVVKVAGISGLVEDITLRRTVLRDLDGIVHSVPNGEISISSNYTKEWSRVNMNVSVAYGEDIDRVIGVINQVGRELAEDSYWGTLVLEAPTVLRVDNLGDSGIELKILGNTRPIKQWDVMGELRRRIKSRFDQEGIEIPWPHTKLYFGNTLEQRAEERKQHSSGRTRESGPTMEAPNALEETAKVLALTRARPWALVTDLDGTISPIASRPTQAIVPETIKNSLAKLSQRGVPVAVLSGRTAEDTSRMVGVEGVTYIGNHGLELMDGTKTKVVGGAEQHVATISRALDEIDGVTTLPGVFIERKGVSATIHYREAADPEEARSVILRAVAHSPAAVSLKVSEGRRVVEVRPPIAVNKGTALRSLVKEHQLRGLLYLGDDVTDLDAFYALTVLRGEGLTTIGVGVLSAENRPEFRLALDLTLNSVEGVDRFLEWITEQVLANRL